MGNEKRITKEKGTIGEEENIAIGRSEEHSDLTMNSLVEATTNTDMMQKIAEKADTWNLWKMGYL